MMTALTFTKLVRHGRASSSIRNLYMSRLTTWPRGPTRDPAVSVTCRQTKALPKSCRCHAQKHFLTLNHQYFSSEASVRIIDNYRVKFKEEENEYFYSFLKQSKTYSKYLVSSVLADVGSVSSSCCSELLESVRNGTFDGSIDMVLSCLQYLSQLPLARQEELFLNKSFTLLILLLTRHISTMNDGMFWKSARIVTTFNFRNCITTSTRELRLKVAQTFDIEFQKRCGSWQKEQYFQAADFYYHFRCSSFRWVQFLPKFFSYIQGNLTSLSSTDIVAVLFQLNLYRHASPVLLNGLVTSVHKYVDIFTADEIGIICSGFHKSEQAVPNNRLLQDFIPPIHRMVSSMADTSLSATMKFIQRSTHKRMAKAVPKVIQPILDLQPDLALRLRDVGLSTSLHVLSMYEHLHDTSEELLSELGRKVMAENLRHCRIKDLANVSRILGNVAFPIPGIEEVFEKVGLELEAESRHAERKEFLDSVLRCLLGMSMRGVYPHLLIEQVLNNEAKRFFTACKQNFWRDLYHLSESVRIEDPSYQGPRLSTPGLLPRPRMSSPRQGQVDNSRPQRTLRESMMEDMVASYSRILGGSEFVSTGMLLKHYQTADIEIRIHSSGQATPASKWYESPGKPESGPDATALTSRLLHLATREPIKKIAVVLHGINAYYRVRKADGSVEACLAGLHASKVRQLQRLGYQVVEIPHFELNKAAKKDDYLKSKTFGTFLEDRS